MGSEYGKPILCGMKEMGEPVLPEEVRKEEEREH